MRQMGKYAETLDSSIIAAAHALGGAMGDEHVVGGERVYCVKVPGAPYKQDDNQLPYTHTFEEWKTYYTDMLDGECRKVWEVWACKQHAHCLGFHTAWHAAE